MKEAASNLEFEEAAKLRDEMRKLEASELEITLNPKISQYNLKSKVYPKGRSTMGMPGTKPKKAISALRWAVSEMEKRYEDVKKAQAKRVEAKYETNDKFSEKMLKDRGLDDTVSRAVMAVFDSLNSNAMYYLKQYNTFDLQENDILRDKESSVDALDSLSFAKQELARKYVELYIDAHHKFSSLMTKKEWRVVIGFGKESFE